MMNDLTPTLAGEEAGLRSKPSSRRRYAWLHIL